MGTEDYLEEVTPKAKKEGMHEVPVGGAGKSQLKSEPFVYDVGDNTEEYTDRIQELTDIGSEEGIEIRSDSLSDFWSFMGLNRNLKQCSLFLLDGGSLSALWTSESEYRIAIRFFGQDLVQFTFIRYNGSRKMSVDSIESGKCNVEKLTTETRKLGLGARQIWQ